MHSQDMPKLCAPLAPLSDTKRTPKSLADVVTMTHFLQTDRDALCSLMASIQAVFADIRVAYRDCHTEELAV